MTLPGGDSATRRQCKRGRRASPLIPRVRWVITPPVPHRRTAIMASRLRDWLELDGGPARMRPTEGLRGAAVLLVFAQHYAMQAIQMIELGPVAAEVAALLRNFGTLGVELFFVLSGFLIYGTLLRRRPGFMPFMRRRVQRLYPAFLVVFVPLLAWHAVRGAEVPVDPLSAGLVILANLLFIPGVFAMDAIMTVAWSLSWEMAFYLVLGLLVPGLGLHAWPRWGRIGAILAVMGLVAMVCDRAPEGAGVFVVPLPLLPLLVGMLLFEIEDGRGPAVPGGLALAAGAASLLVGQYVAWSPLSRTVMETLALALLCSAALRGGNLAALVFSQETLRWLGNMSYSFYLVHGLVLVASFRLAGWLLGAGWPGVTFWLLAAPIFAAGAVASLVLFVLVERPFSLARAAHGQR
ncbi:MAG: acyltransferase family protein [Aquabacterium sp.]